MAPKPHLAYFVHDLTDAAVVRRVQMLHAGGMKVTVLGFRRRGGVIATIDGAPVVDLGMTGDGRLLHRVWAIARTMVVFGRVRASIRDADVLMARNLETLVIAARARGRRRLVYECLDIHRLLLGTGVASQFIQRIERALLRSIDLILTSSNRFAEDYFRPRHCPTTPILLVENKVLAIDGASLLERPNQISAGPPWVIGWFGMLRCRRSLEQLMALVRDGGGRIQVVLAGIPSDKEFSDFDGQVRATPGMRFVGAYSARDLPQLYAEVHFAWAIDYFEEGLNSTWLLPNRLYEAMANGVIPIALSSVETGRWLARNGVGIVVEDAPRMLPGILAKLDEMEFAGHRSSVNALPRSALEIRQTECGQLVDAIVTGILPPG
jgi:succinoglycan biosynthesis protein ExoL